MNGYFLTTPGRMLLGSSALVLLTGAAFVLAGSLVALAVGIPAAIAAALVAVGLSTREHALASLFTIIFGPMALFLFVVAAGVASTESRPAWGWLFGVLGISTAIVALRPGVAPRLG
jgi:hypothetical protein